MQAQRALGPRDERLLDARRQRQVGDEGHHPADQPDVTEECCLPPRRRGAAEQERDRQPGADEIEVGRQPAQCAERPGPPAAMTATRTRSPATTRIAATSHPPRRATLRERMNIPRKGAAPCDEDELEHERTDCEPGDGIAAADRAEHEQRGDELAGAIRGMHRGDDRDHGDGPQRPHHDGAVPEPLDHRRAGRLPTVRIEPREERRHRHGDDDQRPAGVEVGEQIATKPLVRRRVATATRSPRSIAAPTATMAAHLGRAATSVAGRRVSMGPVTLRSPTVSPGVPSPARSIDELATELVGNGVRRVHVLAWRDLDDPDAGGSEVHADEFMRRWAAAGLELLHRTSHAEGMPDVAVRNGYDVVRKGSRYSVFPRTVLSELTRRMGRYDALVEVWNGVPWFSPCGAERRT